MTDQTLDIQRLINADADFQTIEDFIKKPKDETVTTRFGDEIMTLKGLGEEVKKSGGYFKRYTSLAAANADLANIPVDAVVKVTSEADGGDYEKVSAEATSLTKSAYDPLAQAKELDAQALSTKEGIFLVRPYYELDRANKKLYVKLTAYSINDETLFVRDSRYPSAIKTRAAIIADLTASAHPKISTGVTSLLGVTDCICLDYKVSIYYNTVNSTVVAADRPTNGSTYPNYVKLIELDEGEIGECTEKEVILSQVYSQESERILSKNLIVNCYCDNRYSTNINTGLNINTKTGKIEIPNQFAVMYRKISRIAESNIFYQNGDLALDLAADTGTWLVYDLKLNQLVSVSRVAIANYTNPHVTIMIVRHNGSKTAVYQVTTSTLYSINDQIFGTETCGEKATFFPPHSPTGQFYQNRFLPNIDMTANTLTFFADSLVRYKNFTYAIASDVVINLASVASSAKALYFDLKEQSFQLVAWNAQLTQYQRMQWVSLGVIRVTNNFRQATWDLGIPYTVDGSLYGMPKETDNVNAVKGGLYGVAHRGASQTAPENTKAAYILAKEMGFRAVETDLQRTKDGVYICHHDEYLTKVTGGVLTGKVADYNWSELKDLDIGSWKDPIYSGERFLTIKDFCELCYKLNLHAVIELSPLRLFTPTDASVVCPIVKNSGVSHVYIGFNYLSLNNLLQVNKAANIQYVSETITETAISNLKLLRTPFNDPQLSVNHTSITSKQIVDDLKNNHSIKLNTWTVNDEARALELASWGVMSVSSDFINVESLVE